MLLFTDVISGVPVPILAPLLFIIYIDGISFHLVQPLLYADDIPLYKSLILCRTTFNLLNTWVEDHYLQFNKQKYDCYIEKTPNFYIYDVLDHVFSFNYLGVILTSNVLWSPHVCQVCGSGKQLLGMLYR